MVSMTLRPPRILVIVALGMAFGALGGCRPTGTGEGKPVIQEGFDGGSFERRLWSLDRRNPPGVSVSLDRGELRWQIPPGPLGRPAAVIQSRCTIGGDFDLRAQYRIETLPMPREGWSNVEIFISGGDGDAAVIRTNHATEGAGYSLWFEPSTGRDVEGSWKHVPTRDDSGLLRLRRVGQTLEFVAGDGEGQPVGSVEYGGGPIDRVEFRIATAALRSPAVVAFDDLTIEGDRIVEPPPPADSNVGPRTWAAIGAVFAVVLAIGGVILRRRRA